MKLEKMVAIVTGGANGIGRATAIRLAREGADVVVADIDLEQANKVVNEIEALGRRGIAIKGDVSKSEEVKAMANTALDKFGRVDILVNNAGGSARGRSSFFKDSTEEVWDHVLSTNLKGVLNCTRVVINHMIERQSGKVVNIASCAGVVGDVKVADYAAAKAGIIGFTMSLAKEVARYGVNVNCVSPGPIETEGLGRLLSPESMEKMKRTTGLGRLGQPEDIAAMVAFLVSDDANFITGQNYVVGGLRNLGI
ncbi:SDR family NAD(P)-dependent oxidoreductase [Chloroflexota bacterium]